MTVGKTARLITGAVGWGDPAERDPNAVPADLRAGSNSLETARQVYGLTDEKA